MELAGRVFDVATASDNLDQGVREMLPAVRNADEKAYWHRVLRMAALCHDVGHLPFSHAAESQLLPDGWDHERLTAELILTDEMKAIWKKMKPPLDPEDIVKLAVGPKKAKQYKFSPWELLLSEMITGDAFGSDRIDYLLRDSHHIGVAYGRFDHFRLVDTLRILKCPPSDDTAAGGPPALALGVDQGGIQSAEALLLARYLMYSQVYFHHVRRIYDIHLQDFLGEWLEGGKFSTDLNKHLSLTDNEVNVALLEAAFDASKPGHVHAKRILCRQHFHLLYQRNPEDIKLNPDAALAVFEAAKSKFGEDSVRFDRYVQKSGPPDFPVLLRDGSTCSSLSLSQALANIPVVSVDFVFVDPEKLDDAYTWLKTDRKNVIAPKGEEPNE